MKNLQGFTLLELSIVLVIIGLIIGGVTVGQDLIRSAELQRVARDITAYHIAINTFRLKYNALPGDMSNASLYWPDCDDHPTLSHSCDGDGNGKIGPNSESNRTWEHLSHSEVIPESYNYGDGDNSTPWRRFFSSIGGTTRLLHNNDGSWWPDGKTGHTLFLEFAFPAITVQEIQSLDVKMDDGEAFTGRQRILWEELSGPTSGCVNVNTGEWLFNNPADLCTIYTNYGKF